MHVKPLEIVGLIAGFIPGINILASCIKGYFYYKRTKVNEADRAKMEKTAEKVAKFIPSDNNMQSLKNLERESNRSLRFVSLIGACPFLNIVIACFEACELFHLSDLRQLQENPKDQKYLLRSYYQIADIADKDQDEYMTKILFLIHNLGLNPMKITLEVEKSYLSLDGIWDTTDTKKAAFIQLFQDLYKFCYLNYAKDREPIFLIKESLDSLILDYQTKIQKEKKQWNAFNISVDGLKPTINPYSAAVYNHEQSKRDNAILEILIKAKNKLS